MKYVIRPEEGLVLRAFRLPASSIRAALLEGPPGCGKTAFTQFLAQELGASYVYHLMHSWSDDQELFMGIDVASVVAGDATNVRQLGVLARAAELSQTGPVVVCLDELDKVQERTEYLLLDFLQSGRCPLRPGVHIQAECSRLIVCCTSNGERPLADATLRRMRRVRMRPLDRDTVVRIVAEQTGVPASVCRMAAKLAAEEISLQEIRSFAAEVWALAQSVQDCALLATQWLRREGEVHPSQCAALWAEIRAARQQQGVAS